MYKLRLVMFGLRKQNNIQMSYSLSDFWMFYLFENSDAFET